jgi:hypothetical protein
MVPCAPRDVFQLAGRTRPGVIAPLAPRVLDSLDSDGEETRQWILKHSCVRVREAVEGRAGKRD